MNKKNECFTRVFFIKKIVVIFFAINMCATNIDVFAVQPSYEKAKLDELHFKPFIDKATDEQCLACHKEVVERKPLKKSPAGVETKDVKAWYQTVDTYSGEQETFHRRHLVTPLAKRVMNLKCNTCHQGHDSREAAPNPPLTDNKNFTLRKTVNPEVCLMCHGKFNYEVMGVPGAWSEFGESMGNDCLICHAAIRTVRHEVNFLNADEIEKAGKESSDYCYGCHGGRAWYMTSFPYPRNKWDAMAKEIPEWAKDRPTKSKERFLK